MSEKLVSENGKMSLHLNGGVVEVKKAIINQSEIKVKSCDSLGYKLNIGSGKL